MSDPLSPVSPIQGALDVSNVSSDTRRLATRGNLDKAGQQFEAVFVQMMLKSMRSAHLADDLFSSKAIDTFRDMQDQKLSQVMAAHHPLGIGKALTDFLAKAQPELQQPAGDAPAADGGAS